MLTGRESLIRMVGKRRRFLPNREALLSVPIQSSLNLCTDENGRIVTIESEEKSSGDKMDSFKTGGDDGATFDWVNCPVCGKKVRGEHYMINSHLDACLSRGTKRKLTQRTLLQLNFCSQSMTHIYSNESVPLGTKVIHMGSDDSLVQHNISGLPNSGSAAEISSDNYRLPLNVESVMQPYTDYLTENLTSEDGINGRVDTSSLPLKSEVPECDMDVTLDDICGMILETFIVGRKYSDEKDLSPGANISLSRDPDNIKDPNAIKVLSEDSGCCKVLGFLPRGLAQYLSPLIEKYHLNFGGLVTSVPKHSLDIVPIQIVCHNPTSCGVSNRDDIETFTCLWKNVLRIVKSAKNHLPGMRKYHQNFCLLVQEVLRSSPHLFTDDEKHFMESFASLPADSQRLFVRLYMRKGPWFRISNISYPEVLDLQQAVKWLYATGYMCSSEDTTELHDEDMKEILNLLSVSELREIIRVLKKNCNHGSRKQDLIASLISSYEDGLCPFLPSDLLARTGVCIKISSKAESLLWRAERLFFLNGEQDLSAFLLVDLGMVKYPTYGCIFSEEIFSGRRDLLAYEEAIEVAQIMDQSLDENNIELVLRCINVSDSRMNSSSSKAIESTASESTVSFLSCFSAAWVYSKVVLLGASFLEREHRYSDAITLLKRLLICFPCDGRRGYWTLRLSIDLEHIGCVNESLTIAEDGLLDPWVRAGSRMALQRRILRLGKPPRRWKLPSFSDSLKRKITEVHVQGRPLNCETGTKSRFYGEDGDQCGVEQLALQYYAGEGGGWHGVHTESGIWMAIFGIIMWDIIFCDVPNVFCTRFQTAPLDLETDSFYLMRKSLIESHLQKIHDGMAEEILIASWQLHSGTSCRGVNWDRHSLSELRAAVTCIGGPCLASLCRHLAQDYRNWSSGMPDLLLWRFHGEYRGEAKLVEVKGPRDRLSEQQRAWLLLLMDCGFNTEVCKVSPEPMST